MAGNYLYNERKQRLERDEGWLSDIASWFDVYNTTPNQYLKSRFPELRLTDDQWDDLIENYYSTPLYSAFGTDTSAVNTGAMHSDINAMLKALAERPEEPLQENFLNDARAQVAAENEELYADLDALKDRQTSLYNDQLGSMAENYNTARSNILSQQYQQNAQLMDTLQSGMDRSRRNALEAGASAGVRIADNINTLLSVQNKQSATSMETANQLSQMMINQRNAEAQVRGDYANMLSDDTSKRHDIKLSSESRASSLADTNYRTAYNSYDKNLRDWDSNNSFNPFYDYRGQISKYSQNSTGVQPSNNARGRR